jgi:transposase
MIRLKVMRKYDKGHSKLENAEMYYYMLKKFHYFFNKNFDDIPDLLKVHKVNTTWDKYEIRRYLLSIDPDLAYAYNLKQEYQEFNFTANHETCDKELNKLINDFRSSHLKEFQEFGKLLYHWRTEIKNSFIRVNVRIKDKKGNYIIIKKRLSNGPMEGCNSRIKCLIKNANGYKNFDRFRKRVFFSLNKNTPIKGKKK